MMILIIALATAATKPNDAAQQSQDKVFAHCVVYAETQAQTAKCYDDYEARHGKPTKPSPYAADYSDIEARAAIKGALDRIDIDLFNTETKAQMDIDNAERDRQLRDAGLLP